MSEDFWDDLFGGSDDGDEYTRLIEKFSKGRFKCEPNSIKGRIYFVKDNQDKKVPQKVLKVLDNTKDNMKKMQAEWDLYSSIVTSGGKLDHIVQIYDKAYNYSEILALPMERGWKSLENAIDKLRITGTRMQDNMALEYIRQIALGAHEAHNVGYSHNDLKPGNSLLMKTDKGILIKLCDFANSRQTSDITSSQKGTPDFMAPENFMQEAGEVRCSIESDIYSIGATLFTLLHPKIETPFKKCQGELFIKVRKQPDQEYLRERIEELGVSPRIKETLLVCMKPKPEDRYRTVLDFLDALKEKPKPKPKPKPVIKKSADEPLYQNFLKIYEMVSSALNNKDYHNGTSFNTATPENAYKVTKGLDDMIAIDCRIRKLDLKSYDIDMPIETSARIKQIREKRLLEAHKDEATLNKYLDTIPDTYSYDSKKKMFNVALVAFSYGDPVSHEMKDDREKGRKERKSYYSPEEIKRGEVDMIPNLMNFFKEFFIR